ncbi:hypothetical protein NL676_028459 [Syzygium grande]|nr:hypothetical protein NL676_028459 [Syzygium grande]
MDDLERAIIVSFDESGGVDSVLKSQAIGFCLQIKEAPTICRLCVEKLRFCQIFQVQFWCLQTLHEAIRVKYASISSGEKEFIRNSVFSIACCDEESGRVLAGPAFIKNKLAQVIVTLIYFEYPLIWSSVFVDFLAHLSKGGVVIDMFCRVLNALDDELISLDYPRSNEEVAIAAQVKDAMRRQCVPQIVRACYDIVSTYRNSDSEICATVLDTLRRYISWIDIGLIANDVFLPFLFELMLFDGISEQFRGAAAGCVLAVVSKRMDPQSKLSLLKNVQISRVIGLVSDDRDSELASSVASLLTGYAVEVLECSKRLTGETKKTSFELLDDVLPSVFYVMQNCERDNLDTLDKIGREEEGRMMEYRKDFFVLLRNIGRVAPDITQQFIRNSLDAAVTSSGGNIEEVEAALSLLYALGESLSDETIKSGRGLLSDLVPMLLASRFACHSNRVVALVYLDTITRYAKFVQEYTQYIPMLLAAFLDGRGIHHPNINVSRRASYLFMRVVKSLKSNLVPFIETILQSLQDTVAQFTNVDYSSKALSGAEDGSHIFEAIGILIGMEDVPLDRQSGYLSSLLIPLCRQVEELLLNSKILTMEEAPGKIATIQQVIMAINALSKGFSERLVTASRPGIGLMFKRTLDVLLQILVVYPKIEPLRSKVMSFIHRMVDTLGASVFPYLPKALEQLLAEIEPKEMASFLLLLNQIICKFNNLAHDVLEELFPAIAGRIFSIIPREAITSGPGANTEEIREIQELQQTLYTFLYDIATHDLSSVFLSPKSRHYLDQLMQLLLDTACNHKDILVRKACVQIFIRLIKDWCSRPHEEKVPGFQKFMIEGFATNCCLYSVLDRSFEFRDANTLILFGEIVLAQKIMYEKFGDDFLLNFLSKGFMTTHCPQHLVEQYCQKLQGGDIKSLKSSYRSLIENLRHQQNGSLVFR